MKLSKTFDYRRNIQFSEAFSLGVLQHPRTCLNINAHPTNDGGANHEDVVSDDFNTSTCPKTGLGSPSSYR